MPEFRRVAGTEEIASGQTKIYEVDGNSIAICNVNGNYFAIQNMCPHRGGPVGEGEIEDGTITCPWHGFRFDLKTGACAFNPAMKLTLYDLKVEGPDIKIGI
jgi:nitrite reductase/ring-hydroxylating ferredoxin subunit